MKRIPADLIVRILNGSMDSEAWKGFLDFLHDDLRHLWPLRSEFTLTDPVIRSYGLDFIDRLRKAGLDINDEESIEIAYSDWVVDLAVRLR